MFMKKNKKENEGMLTDEGLISKTLQQPAVIPEEVSAKVEELWLADQIFLYAMVDLDEGLNLRASWVVLGQKRLAIARLTEDDIWAIQDIQRSEIHDVVESPGLSAFRVEIKMSHGSVVLRYTHRQKRAVGHLLYMIKQEVEHGRNFELEENLEQSSEQIYQKAVLTPVKEAQASTSQGQMAVFWRLLLYLKPYRTQVFWGMMGAMLLTLVSLVPAYVTGYIVDHVIRPHQTGKITAELAFRTSMYAVAGLLLIYGLREAFAWVRLKTMSVLGEYVARDLRRELYTHMHRLSVSYFSSRQTGSLISRVSSDTDRIWDFIAFGVVEVASSLLMLVGLGSVLIFMDWKLGLMVVLPVPLILVAIARHGQVMQKLFIRAWRKWSSLTDCLSDTFPGIRVVKAFHQQSREVKRFNERNDGALNEFNRIHETWTSFWPRMMLSIYVLIVAVWFFGVPRVLGSDVFWNLGPLSLGHFVSFLLYLTMFIQPIEIIGQMARMINRATSSAHRVFEVLDTEPEGVEERGRVKLENLQGEITFENVSFSYDGVRSVLSDMSFHVKAGETIGLVGPSGGGKTTLTHLLARFYDFDGGGIYVDGVDLRELEMQGYREQLGIVLQEPYLFHGTVLENIRYGAPQASLEEVVEAARMAHAHEFVMKLTHGYDTMVGEKGHTLSGGERQRISIARAILRNPKVLILDEATSAVDTETESLIQEALDRLVEGRTVFAIAHRLSTLRKADRLFVIKDGRLVEQGTHKELLLKENGLYQKLYEMQQQLNSQLVM